jgi:hypothetical protein
MEIEDRYADIVKLDIKSAFYCKIQHSLASKFSLPILHLNSKFLGVMNA